MEQAGENERARRGLLAGWILGVLLLSACTAPGSLRGADAVEGPRRGAPSWVAAPEGWDKLERIESWLVRDADEYAPYWRLQGELALAEGRLAFARRDAAVSPGAAWSARVAGAREGFERVAADPAASESQRSRARLGLEQLGVLVPAAGANLAGVSEGVLPRSVWRASRAAPARLTRTSGSYAKITVHHTADVPGARFDGSLQDSTDTLRRVQSEHMDGRAYGDIGYHYLIDAAGRVYQGRDLTWQGAHAGGVRNRRNIGICLLGNFETQRPNPAALAALEELVEDLRREHRIERGAVVCHRELKNTLCPGAHLAAWTTRYRQSGPSLARLGTSPASAAAASRAARRATREASAPAPRSTGGGTVR